MNENKKHPDVEEIFEEFSFDPKKMVEDLKETAKATCWSVEWKIWLLS